MAKRHVKRGVEFGSTPCVRKTQRIAGAGKNDGTLDIVDHGHQLRVANVSLSRDGVRVLRAELDDWLREKGWD